MHPSRPAAIAVIVGSLVAVGCMNTEPKESLVLGKDTQTILGGSNASASKTTKSASFDPSATGGSGLSVKNSFNRTTPGPGTGTTTGNFASSVSPPQIGQTPTAVVPPMEGLSRGEPSNEPGRTSMHARAAPPPPITPPAPPTDASPFSPKLDPPVNDPPVRPAIAIEPVSPPSPIRPTVAIEPALPTPPVPIRPVMPEPDRGALPTPVMPGGPVAPVPPVAPPAPVAPVAPPATGMAPNETLPLAPAVVPSPSEVPIPGVQATPKLPPAPPIRPQ